jgi:hypothetical protein
MLELHGKLAKQAGTSEAATLVDQIIAELPKVGAKKAS